jgi:hypothetical protein
MKKNEKQRYYIFLFLQIIYLRNLKYIRTTHLQLRTCCSHERY